jgi:uncharacterized protein YdeI (YjbR/CyaY-like superfamily)
LADRLPAQRRKESDTAAMDSESRVSPDTRAAWREWLAAHHRDSTGVWLVSWKRRTGRPTVAYEEAVEEALCFGWIDGRLRPLDGDRSMQWFSPRRPKSTWARSNKERVARLEAAGLMVAAGLEAVERARGNGLWNSLDEIDALVMPADLAEALDARPDAREHFDAATASSRRMALAWVTQVKRPETRAAHVARVADVAARGEPISNLWRRD